MSVNGFAEAGTPLRSLNALMNVAACVLAAPAGAQSDYPSRPVKIIDGSTVIMPAVVGGLLAYICRPLVARLERYRIPRALAVGLLLLMFAFAPGRRGPAPRGIDPAEVPALFPQWDLDFSRPATESSCRSSSVRACCSSSASFRCRKLQRSASPFSPAPARPLAI